MNNPLSSLSVTNPRVPEGTFRRGFMKGAGSGAMMMGIFYGLALGASALIPGVNIISLSGGLVSAVVHILPALGVGTLATGLFSGINASQRASESVRSAANVSHVAQRAPVRSPESSVSDSVNRAAHNSRAWTDRVSENRSSGQDRVSQILADGRLDDQGRAAAILREREQSNTLNASR